MGVNLKSLGPPDSHHLQASIGWLGLGNWQEANEELEKIAPALRGHPDVLEIRFEIYAKAGKWDFAVEIGRVLIQMHPEKPQFWITQAYAVRRMPTGGIPQAKEILGKAQLLFPKEPLFAYNLACYESQLGNLQAAWKWLEGAIGLGDPKMVKLMVLQDPDLEPLWAKIGEI
jgi:tetratricopeptide (TPR) repeat protein